MTTQTTKPERPAKYEVGQRWNWNNIGQWRDITLVRPATPVPALPVSVLDPATEPCRPWCGVETRSPRWDDRPCDGPCFRPAHGKDEWRCFCSEECRDAGRPLRPASPTSEGGSAGMKPGKRCTKRMHRASTPHEHDPMDEMGWTHVAGKKFRCPYIQPPPQGDGTGAGDEE